MPYTGAVRKRKNTSDDTEEVRAIMDESPLPIIDDTTGLSAGYRALWRLKYLGLSIFRPCRAYSDRQSARAYQVGPRI